MEIRIRVGDTEVEAVAMDVSEEGLAVYTANQIPPVSIVTVRFIVLNEKAIRAEDRSRCISVEGKVRYNVLHEEARMFRFGVEFMDISSEDRSFISKFISRSK